MADPKCNQAAVVAALAKQAKDEISKVGSTLVSLLKGDYIETLFIVIVNLIGDFIADPISATIEDIVNDVKDLFTGIINAAIATLLAFPRMLVAQILVYSLVDTLNEHLDILNKINDQITGIRRVLDLVVQRLYAPVDIQRQSEVSIARQELHQGLIDLCYVIAAQDMSKNFNASRYDSAIVRVDNAIGVLGGDAISDIDGRAKDKLEDNDSGMKDPVGAWLEATAEYITDELRDEAEFWSAVGEALKKAYESLAKLVPLNPFGADWAVLEIFKSGKAPSSIGEFANIAANITKHLGETNVEIGTKVNMLATLDLDFDELLAKFAKIFAPVQKQRDTIAEIEGEMLENLNSEYVTGIQNTVLKTMTPSFMNGERLGWIARLLLLKKEMEITSPLVSSTIDTTNALNSFNLIVDYINAMEPNPAESLQSAMFTATLTLPGVIINPGSAYGVLVGFGTVQEHVRVSHGWASELLAVAQSMDYLGDETLGSLLNDLNNFLAKIGVGELGKIGDNLANLNIRGITDYVDSVIDGTLSAFSLGLTLWEAIDNLLGCDDVELWEAVYNASDQIFGDTLAHLSIWGRIEEIKKELDNKKIQMIRMATSFTGENEIAALVDGTYAGEAE